MCGARKRYFIHDKVSKEYWSSENSNWEKGRPQKANENVSLGKPSPKVERLFLKVKIGSQ